MRKYKEILNILTFNDHHQKINPYKIIIKIFKKDLMIIYGIKIMLFFKTVAFMIIHIINAILENDLFILIILYMLDYINL